MTGRLSCIVIAPCGQTRAHLPQAMQPTLQASMTALPFACEEQAIYTLASAGMRENSFLGQASMHAPQEMHLSSVCAQPPGREMAPSGQTREQLPSPRHPYLQDLCPPASLFSSAQSFAPL